MWCVKVEACFLTYYLLMQPYTTYGQLGHNTQLDCICTLVYSGLNTQSNTLRPTRLPYALERILWCAVRDEFPKASSKGLGTRLRMLHNNECLWAEITLMYCLQLVAWMCTHSLVSSYTENVYVIVIGIFVFSQVDHLATSHFTQGIRFSSTHHKCTCSEVGGH